MEPLLDATAAFTREAMEHLGENELMLTSAVQGFLATAEWLRGRLAAAEEAFESSVEWWRRAGQVTTTAWGITAWLACSKARGVSTPPSGPASERWPPPASRDRVCRRPPRWPAGGNWD
jgi:hypothetical protein